jgi:chromosome partitioning protein
VDVVFFDTPPSLGLWLQAALAAADGVVVVTHCSVFSAKQLHDLVHTVETIRQRVNPSLAVDGLIVNEVRPNTTLQSEYVRSYREAFGSEMLEPVIPMRTVVGEAQQNGIPIEFYGDSKASEVRRIYRVLAGRLLERAGLGHGRLTAAAGGAGKRTATAATE